MAMRSTLIVSGLVLAAGLAVVRAQEFELLDEGVPEAGPDPVALGTPAPGYMAQPEWKRPDGPIRVALQAGHWQAAQAPAEQAQLRVNGTRGGGKAEWEVNLGIARLTAELLRQEGYIVDVLPTTVPPGYWADLFIAIHADGSPSSSTSGYRAAAPRRDATGRAESFVGLLESSYGEATGLRHYPDVTRRMRGYYAFNYRRYYHALHPMTVGVILETGFLSSPHDRAVIVSGQEKAARGIAAAVNRWFEPMPRGPDSIPRFAEPIPPPASRLPAPLTGE
jgi:N-acetylmuramoyl-L-alanine amidase